MKTLPLSRSVCTICTLAMPRRAATAAAVEPLNTPAAAFHGPLSRAAPVDSDRRRASRAAMAAPSIPTQSVRCCTMPADPGMPKPKAVRRMISATGRTAMAPSAADRTTFSDLWKRARQPAIRRSARRLAPVPARISCVIRPPSCRP